MRSSSLTGLLASLIASLLLSPTIAFAQECPQRSSTGLDALSASRTLEGKLIFHDGIRQWFELKLDQVQCEQSSTQLVSLTDTEPALEVLRGCRVKSTGPIGFAQTGYFSLETWQDVKQIEPQGSCKRKPPFPDYSGQNPDPALKDYRVDMHIEYVRGEHPIRFRVTSGDKVLRPWQVYASYELTGGFVLYGHCGKGFVVDKVFGTPGTAPLEIDGTAAFDPESAAASGKKNLMLGYTCVRDDSEPEAHAANN